MQPDSVDQSLLTRYLLGQLSEDEQVEVEDRAFADKNYLNEVEAAEADLIDSYVRGELSQPERRAFEGRFLTSERRRKKVAFARDLARVLAELKSEEGRVIGRSSVLAAFTWWRPQFRLAAGLAGVLIVAGVSWLGFQNAAMRSRVAALEAGRREFESREAALRQQLTNEEQRNASLTPPIKQEAPTERAPVIASLVLLPGLTRGESRVAQLALSPSAQIANIEIQLEPRDDYPRFRAELRTRRGEEVLTVANLQKHRTAGASSVGFSVPAASLPSGEYELALKGVAEDRSAQDVGYYYFAVKKF